jgi:hypothetical protein
MLPWWGWVAFWTLLVAGSAAWLGVLMWRVWGSTTALAAEVERAGALVAELEEHADRLRVPEEPPLAVIRDPREVRAQRRAQRAEQAAARRARRAERLPPWARVH